MINDWNIKTIDLMWSLIFLMHFDSIYQVNLYYDKILKIIKRDVWYGGDKLIKLQHYYY